MLLCSVIATSASRTAMKRGQRHRVLMWIKELCVICPKCCATRHRNYEIGPERAENNCRGVLKMGSQFLYLPLALPFFLIFVVLFVFVFFLLPLKLMKYAYEELGVSSSSAVLLLLGSLIGSYINIPVAVISRKAVMASQMADYFGMRYPIAVANDWGGTVLAINVGGAV